MKRFVILSLAAFAVAGCASNQNPEATAARAAENATNLETALADRTAQPPTSCVNQRLLGGNRSYGEGVILFEGQSRNMVYVNRPAGGCPELSAGRALKTRTTTGQLCRGDIVTVFDPVSGIDYGSCGLGDFVPYTRVR